MFEHIVTYYIAQQDAANQRKEWSAGDLFWDMAKDYCDLQDAPVAEVPAWRRGLSGMPALPVDGMLGWTPPVWR